MLKGLNVLKGLNMIKVLKGLKAEGIKFKKNTHTHTAVRGLKVMKELKADGIGLRMRLRKFGVRVLRRAAAAASANMHDDQPAL